MSTHKEILKARLDALIGRERRIAVHLRGEDGRRELDPADAANLVANDEVLEGLEEAARSEIREIREALARVDDGTYGVCERCGGDIGDGRLALVPHARRCARCAAE